VVPLQLSTSQLCGIQRNHPISASADRRQNGDSGAAWDFGFEASQKTNALVPDEDVDVLANPPVLAEYPISCARAFLEQRSQGVSNRSPVNLHSDLSPSLGKRAQVARQNKHRRHFRRPALRATLPFRLMARAAGRRLRAFVRSGA